METKQNWHFTFCIGSDLGKKYTMIKGTYNEARDKMFNSWGKHWAFQYSEKEFAGQAEKYNLTEIKAVCKYCSTIDMKDSEIPGSGYCVLMRALVPETNAACPDFNREESE